LARNASRIQREITGGKRSRAILTASSARSRGQMPRPLAEKVRSKLLFAVATVSEATVNVDSFERAAVRHFISTGVRRVNKLLRFLSK
jgi:hypothetical protein